MDHWQGYKVRDAMQPEGWDVLRMFTITGKSGNQGNHLGSVPT